MGTRHNVSDLSVADRLKFLDAIMKLKQTPGKGGVLNRYDEYVAMHMSLFYLDSGPQSNPHGGPGFLPWHRQFLLSLEKDLGVDLPYWKWDGDASDTTAVIGDNFLGLDWFNIFAASKTQNDGRHQGFVVPDKKVVSKGDTVGGVDHARDHNLNGNVKGSDHDVSLYLVRSFTRSFDRTSLNRHVGKFIFPDDELKPGTDYISDEVRAVLKKRNIFLTFVTGWRFMSTMRFMSGLVAIWFRQVRQMILCFLCTIAT